MWSGLFCRGHVALRGGQSAASHLRWLAGMGLLALLALFLTTGAGQMGAAVAGKAHISRQPAAISSNAVPGSAAVPAANARDGFTASVEPVQASSILPPTGTPAPGSTVPVVGTSTPLSAATGSIAVPPSNSKTALKDGIIAAGLGLLVLLALLGAITFFLPRLRSGPDLARFNKANTRRAAWGSWSGRAGQFSRRKRRVGPPASSQGRPYASMPPSGRPDGRSKTRPLDGGAPPRPANGVSSAQFSQGESYPWQRPEQASLALPPPPERKAPPASKEPPRRRPSASKRAPARDGEGEPPPPRRRPGAPKRAPAQDWDEEA